MHSLVASSAAGFWAMSPGRMVSMSGIGRALLRPCAKTRETEFVVRIDNPLLVDRTAYPTRESSCRNYLSFHQGLKQRASRRETLNECYLAIRRVVYHCLSPIGRAASSETIYTFGRPFRQQSVESMA